MTDLADLLPGFAAHWIDGPQGRLFARSGGEGLPVVLLHGFPQSHVMWHLIAPTLARSHHVVCMDLRGYGWSSAPPGEGEGAAYSKREMARDVTAVMDALGHSHFTCIGHDRGARVAYRLALDHPGRVDRLALIDIVPTLSMWEGMNAGRAMQVYHWTFLAQPEPMPETLIGPASRFWLDQTLASWTAAKSLAPFDPRALAHYHAFFNDPAHLHATCEDYRAGATIDLAHDRESQAAGQHILCPTLVLWGQAGIPAAGASPLDIWRATFAPQAQGQGIAGGHFLPEENAGDTLAALEAFLAGR
jgi:haloacetate dehalogenase